MSSKNRDEFSKETKRLLERGAGGFCSYPGCRQRTSGSKSDGKGAINVGVAAHICAAAPGGPRYDSTMSSAERRSPENGIWLCANHARAADSGDPAFTVEEMRRWKQDALAESFHGVTGHPIEAVGVAKKTPEDETRARVRAAAEADLETFRNSRRWSPAAIGRTVDIEELNESVNTSTLAKGLTTLGDLVLVAPPGMGKTTILFQIAESVLEGKYGSPIVVPLGNWAANDESLIDSILSRRAFHTIARGDFESVAAKPGVYLLLDGWNELDKASQRRAAAEIERLQRELPDLRIVATTREQRLNAPIGDRRVRLQSLSEREQMEIARALRGAAGEGIVEQAWRTAGVRELVTIPLYLTTLLALPEDVPFPTTKEEVLRRFVARHEEDYQRREALEEVTDGTHARYLQALAETATRTANTTMGDAIARRAVSDAAAALEDEGQIADRPKQSAVLDALVNHHLLIHEKESHGYAFQHQQFQEWYASHFVEGLMEKSVTNDDAREKLKAEVLDRRGWEESILFACERLARGDEGQQETCATATLAALEVDPMLAAEMIWRSSEGVWQHVAPCVEDFVRRWHTPGKVDRAVRFMIISGREEFSEHVWPLITDEDDQVHLRALRAGTQFRPTVLGRDAALRIERLSPELRQNILQEIAMYGRIDGLEFAANIGKSDPAPEVRAKVAEALAFRAAYRHVADVLRNAGDKTFDLLSHQTLLDHIADEKVRRRLSAARESERRKGVPAHTRLRRLVYERGGEDRSTEVATIIGEMEIEERDRHGDSVIYLASERYPRAVAEGMLQRVRNGRSLPYRATKYMEAGRFSLEDECLLNVALDCEHPRNARAEAAASVLGPECVGRLIDRMGELEAQARETEKESAKKTRDAHTAIEDRICCAQPGHVLAAIESRAREANNENIEDFSNLLTRYGSRNDLHGRVFDDAARTKIVQLAKDWGERLLSSGDATRRELASIAALAEYAPSGDLVPVLERLLDEEHRLLRGFQEQAGDDGGQQSEATQEAHVRWDYQYEHAFARICCPESTALMQELLRNEEFSRSAARVLAAHWRSRSEPGEEKGWPRPPVFARVAEKRAAREAKPEATSEEAEAIFGAVEELMRADSTDTHKRCAVELAIIACALPHGERDETISRVMADAGPKRKLALLTRLVLAGEAIDVEHVAQGIDDIIEHETRTGHWVSGEDRTLQQWLRLLPFTTGLSRTIEIVRTLPEPHRTPYALEELLAALEDAPGDDVEEIIFELAEAEPSLYVDRSWLDAVFARETRSAATRLLDLASQGAFHGGGNTGDHDIYTRLASLIDKFPDLRGHLYELFENAIGGPGMRMLAQTIAENPDEEGLMRLMQLDIEHKHARTAWLAIERVVTRREPVENSNESYHVLPVAASEVRRKLLARTRDGGPDDIAARYLNEIDEFRDQFGTDESEPRHPDLASRKTWPIADKRKDTPNTA